MIKRGVPDRLFHCFRKILRGNWNPIGFDDSLPEDEYDSYFVPIHTMLCRNTSILSLVFYLRNLEDYHMGLKRKKPNFKQKVYRFKRFFFLFKIVFMLKKAYNKHYEQ